MCCFFKSLFDNQFNIWQAPSCFNFLLRQALKFPHGCFSTWKYPVHIDIQPHSEWMKNSGRMCLKSRIQKHHVHGAMLDTISPRMGSSAYHEWNDNVDTIYGI
jgi:hypothetical protein